MITHAHIYNTWLAVYRGDICRIYEASPRNIARLAKYAKEHHIYRSVVAPGYPVVTCLCLFFTYETADYFYNYLPEVK